MGGNTAHLMTARQHRDRKGQGPRDPSGHAQWPSFLSRPRLLRVHHEDQALNTWLWDTPKPHRWRGSKADSAGIVSVTGGTRGDLKSNHSVICFKILSIRNIFRTLPETEKVCVYVCVCACVCSHLGIYFSVPCETHVHY